MKRTFHADYCETAHGVVGAMLADIRRVMSERGLKTLRLEGNPKVIVYLPDPVLSLAMPAELMVHGIYLIGDRTVLATAPGMKILNTCVTSKKEPDIDPDDELSGCVDVDDDNLEYLTLLNIDDAVAEAMEVYDDEHCR